MDIQQVKVEFVKTYATEANAVKAAEKLKTEGTHLRYIVIPVIENNLPIRYGVAFLGQSALDAWVQFRGFNVLG